MEYVRIKVEELSLIKRLRHIFTIIFLGRVTVFFSKQQVEAMLKEFNEES